jgi:hypothetical protein
MFVIKEDVIKVIKREVKNTLKKFDKIWKSVKNL